MVMIRLTAAECGTLRRLLREESARIAGPDWPYQRTSDFPPRVKKLARIFNKIQIAQYGSKAWKPDD